MSDGSDSPQALIVEVKKGGEVPFDGVLVDEWAIAELYTQVEVCSEVKHLVNKQLPLNFVGGIAFGASVVFLFVVAYCKMPGRVSHDIKRSDRTREGESKDLDG